MIENQDEKIDEMMKNIKDNKELLKQSEELKNINEVILSQIKELPNLDQNILIYLIQLNYYKKKIIY